jgi:hypothetical protein
MRRTLRSISPALGAVLLLTITACTGNSQAASVLESDNISLRATISYYQALDPTMTAESALMAQQLATIQAALDQSRQEVRSLTIRLNNMTQPGGEAVAANPTPITVPNPNPGTGDTTGGTTGGFGSVRVTPTPPLQVVTTPQGGPLRVQAPSGLVLDQIVTARGQDQNGCAVDPTTTFSLSTDSRVLVITVARNYQSGTNFMTRWEGQNGFLQVYEWATERGGTDMCVHFYIEPRALQMAPGIYTVVFMARDSSGVAESAPIPFTLTQ